MKHTPAPVPSAVAAAENGVGKSHKRKFSEKLEDMLGGVKELFAERRKQLAKALREREEARKQLETLREQMQIVHSDPPLHQDGFDVGEVHAFRAENAALKGQNERLKASLAALI